jgi:hypothetical protein
VEFDIDYPSRQERVAQEAQESLLNVLQGLPSPESLTDKQLEEVSESLACIDHTLNEALEAYTDELIYRGIELPHTEEE